MRGWRSAIAAGVLCIGTAAFADDVNKNKGYGGSGQEHSGQQKSGQMKDQEHGRTYGGAGDTATGMTGSDMQKYDKYAQLQENEFLWTFRQANQMEVDLAKLGQEKASNREVKDYARMLQRDHQQALNDIKSFAQKQNLTLKQPSAEMATDIKELDKDHAKMMKDRFKGVTGSAFDNQFLTAMIEEHQALIGKVKAVQSKYSDRPMNDLLTKQLPVLQRHLDRAQELQRNIGVGGAGKNIDKPESGTYDQGRGGAGMESDKKFDEPSKRQDEGNVEQPYRK